MYFELKCSQPIKELHIIFGEDGSVSARAEPEKSSEDSTIPFNQPAPIPSVVKATKVENSATTSVKPASSKAEDIVNSVVSKAQSSEESSDLSIPDEMNMQL